MEDWKSQAAIRWGLLNTVVTALHKPCPWGGPYLDPHLSAPRGGAAEGRGLCLSGCFPCDQGHGQSRLRLNLLWTKPLAAPKRPLWSHPPGRWIRRTWWNSVWLASTLKGEIFKLPFRGKSHVSVLSLINNVTCTHAHVRFNRKRPAPGGNLSFTTWRPTDILLSLASAQYFPITWHLGLENKIHTYWLK